MIVHLRPDKLELANVRRVFPDAKPVNGHAFLATCTAHDDRHPSLSIERKNGKTLVVCSSQRCEKDDIARGAGLRDQKAMYDALEGRTADGPRSRTEAKLGRRSPQKIKRRRVRLLKHDLAKVWQACAENLSDDLVEALARDRGLPFEAFEGVELGWVPERRRFALPYRDQDNQIIGIRLLRPGDEPKWVEGSKAGLLGAHRLRQHRSAPVYICEGEWDYFALSWLLRTLGVDAVVVCVPGANIFDAAWRPWLKGRRVGTLYDHDEAGRDGELKAADHLTDTVRDITHVHWPAGLPDGFDVRDWIRYGAVEKADPGGCWAKLQELFRPNPRLRPGMPPEVEALFTQQTFNPTDTGNAEYFAKRHGRDLRWHPGTHQWFRWTDAGWRLATGSQIHQAAKEAVRDRYRHAEHLTDLKQRQQEAAWAIGSESRKRLGDMLELAKLQHTIATEPTAWDHDPLLLGVLNGVVDLRTGQLRHPRLDDLLTRHSPVAFNPDAKCPRWITFLKRVFAQHPDLPGWLQRAIGYSLTAETREQCLFLLYGLGANGKSTLLNTLLHLFGAYGFNMPFSTLELSQRGSIPNDVAALAGRRFVSASETNDGTRLNEARIKALTGGDMVTARFLHGEFFSFTPVAKFWLSVNHKPTVRDHSYGFWRRIRLIPFVETFKGKDADPDLPRALLAEADGILAWAVRGCLAWQQKGLAPPAVVQQETATYEHESDPVGDFLDAECELDARAVTSARGLFSRYQLWAIRAGLAQREQMTQTRFGRRMGERFTKTTTKDKRNLPAYQGVRLREVKR